MSPILTAPSSGPADLFGRSLIHQRLPILQTEDPLPKETLLCVKRRLARRSTLEAAVSPLKLKEVEVMEANTI